MMKKKWKKNSLNDDDDGPLIPTLLKFNRNFHFLLLAFFEHKNFILDSELESKINNNN